jgi:glycogen phosphorylase
MSIESLSVVSKSTDLKAQTELASQYGVADFGTALHGLYERHLLLDNSVDPAVTNAREHYEAFARSLRDILAHRWVRTNRTYHSAKPKRIYYLSMEFLIGRSLANNVTNLLLDPLMAAVINEKSVDWLALLQKEPDAGLGNGGLGRLAACFLDSMATMQLPATGYGLRYEYGMFKQTIENGWQQEVPDNWFRHPDPWEVARPYAQVRIKLNSSFVLRDGVLRAIANRDSYLFGVPYDRPVIGYGGKNINTLRLWAAAAPDYFDFKEFSSGDFVGALAETLAAESLTRVLYPDDSTTMGQALRFVQEYFLVACSMADIVRRFRHDNDDWNAFPDKVAIQLNDTHPTMCVPELMRILLDEVQLTWEKSWDITQRTLAYTNHTLLPEALEKWPVDWFSTVVPRHLEIIYEINRRFLDDVRKKFPGDEDLVRRVSLIEEGPVRRVRMANLAIVGSHSTNGVAAIHTQLLRTTTVKDLAVIFPERFNNKTNGVTPRRWLRLCNPPLASTITEAIGEGWITDLRQLSRLAPLADDASFRSAFIRAQNDCKAQFTDWVKATST